MALAVTAAVGLQPIVAPLPGDATAPTSVGLAADPRPSARATLTSHDVPSVDPADSNERQQVVAELTDARTQDFGLVGVTWRAGTAGKDLRIEVRTRRTSEWGDWGDLEVEDRQASEGVVSRAGTAVTWVGDSDGVAVRLLSSRGAPQDVRLELIDGGEGLAQDPSQGIALMSARSATSAPSEPMLAATDEVRLAPKPRILTRKAWGVDRRYETSCAKPISVPAAKGIVLHHTAGQNGYSREEAPGIVRGIHLYHTRSLGWCDIGYNFLVDAYGTIYAGRRGGQDKQVRGAHAGNWEANTYLTGISMMGNYETRPVPEATKNAVVELSAWRLSYFGLDALGSVTVDGGSLDVISGHRDIHLAGIRPATATACPGKYGYTWLNEEMRSLVQARIDAAPIVVPEEEATGTARLAGSTRYATAAAISAATFPTRGGAVFLASGESFPDALSGGPAAATMSAPILLTARDALPPETAAELERLAPSNVYILGGELTVSPSVEAEVSALTDRVTRLAGRDRYAAGVEISRAFWSTAPTVYVASGTTYPDALSGGALAARTRAPILLSTATGLPSPIQAELARLNPTNVVVLGGELTLTQDVEQNIAQVLPDASVSRLQGRDRYETSAVIAAAGWASTDVAYFAAGTKFPDALAGVPAAAVTGAPLLLTRRRCMPAPIAELTQGFGQFERVLLGGPLSLGAGAATSPCA